MSLGNYHLGDSGQKRKPTRRIIEGMPARPKSYFHPSSTCLNPVYWIFFAVFNHLSKGPINYCRNDLAKADHHLKMLDLKDKVEG